MKRKGSTGNARAVSSGLGYVLALKQLRVYLCLRVLFHSLGRLMLVAFAFVSDDRTSGGSACCANSCSCMSPSLIRISELRVSWF